ncbi:MAG: type II CRISPR RNA-guided endonuclease Cas9 [Proteobacteria bacterium]|jgi:CRISPR-associated endonuclease Csn1|nr:type II CRISPR RNA-guided endonuclease Cas9 [Pseudomonadota bacterium]
MGDNQQTGKSPVSNEGPFTFGLDIGIASVGWSVISERRIIDLGVRAFDKAETADKGESLNLQRRKARLLRRRLWRRAWRLTKLGRLLKRHGVLNSVDALKTQPNFTDSTWALRVAGLDRQLTPMEWARVIYHLCKHRGFHWISRAEERKADEDTKGESGRVKAGLAHTKKLMTEKGYRTAAEMVLAEFPDAQRNKRGDYGKALSRVLLDAELASLFASQREHGNPYATPALEEALRGRNGSRSGLLWSQKPALAGKDLLKMLGHCTFEKGEYRAPKASFTAERHVWLTRLNNLRVIVDGVSRGLNDDERRFSLPLPYQSGEKFTYKTLRKALVQAGKLGESFRFGGLAYPSGKQKEEEKAKDPEDQPLVKLPAWHELRLAFNKSGLKSEWDQISTAAIEGRPEQLDGIAWVLSVYKDDKEVEAELEKLGLPGDSRVIETLLGIRFDKFHALSLKALRQIVPLMEQGHRYDEAVAKIPDYGHHSQRFVAGAGSLRFLPPFYDGRDKDGRMKFRDDIDIPRNPVVLRALNQARKVVNALIKEYGAPWSVHIEMARDLSRPMDERRDIEKLQKEYREKNEKAREQFTADFNRRPSGVEFEKWLLYREQHGKCGYSLEPLDLHRVIDDPSYVQVDHALPYSRSYDDSKNNKVLALTKVNQDKGNRTPYEFLDGASESERWRNFVSWVEGNKSYRQAKRSRLLRKNYGAEEASSFKDRNLNDTRYICKFFKNYVEQYLQLADGSDNKRCVVLNGQLTSFLRARWGLIKTRDESDRHHALDATVVAACSHAMVKRLADYARKKELENLREGFPDPETGEINSPSAHQRLTEHFPDPWSHFRHELTLRLKTDDVAALREEAGRLGSYSPQALECIRPLFVSRAPQRRNGGAAHKETIYAQPQRLLKQGGVTQKVALSSLTLKDLNNLADPHRNEKLYSAIRTRLEAHAGKADKAFPADNPLRKPDKQGNSTGPVVRTVTLVIDKLSGLAIRGGIAKNDSMLRVDFFLSSRKFHVVPVYVHHKVAGLPNRAIVAYKDESEWTEVQESDFLFSAYPNDLLRVTLKKDSVLGYYAGCDRSTGAISLWVHDRNQAVGKDGLVRGIGVKTCISLEKLHVDTLGRAYPAPAEKRSGLA